MEKLSEKYYFWMENGAQKDETKIKEDCVSCGPGCQGCSGCGWGGCSGCGAGCQGCGGCTG